MPSVNEGRLAALSPTAFENLTFDLVRADLMENVHWRTPGADGGRDIEGELPHQDFAGHTRRSRWLIECKRYKAAVDWPTVWPKVAYADNSQADFLLMVTTGKFSTRCLDEIEKWNSRDRKPAIRVWPGHEVAFRLFLKPSIAVKYGLLDGVTPSAVEVSGLALHVARMAQAAVAHSDPTKMARCAHAASSLASLLYTRSVDLVQAGAFRDSDHASSESLPTFVSGVLTSDLHGFDWVGLLSYISCVYVIVKQHLTAVKRPDGTLFVSSNHSLPAGLPDIALLREVAFWSGLTVTKEGEGICLTPQTFV